LAAYIRCTGNLGTGKDILKREEATKEIGEGDGVKKMNAESKGLTRITREWMVLVGVMYPQG